MNIKIRKINKNKVMFLNECLYSKPALSICYLYDETIKTHIFLHKKTMMELK